MHLLLDKGGKDNEHDERKTFLIVYQVLNNIDKTFDWIVLSCCPDKSNEMKQMIEGFTAIDNSFKGWWLDIGYYATFQTVSFLLLVTIRTDESKCLRDKTANLHIGASVCASADLFSTWELSAWYCHFYHSLFLHLAILKMFKLKSSLRQKGSLSAVQILKFWIFLMSTLTFWAVKQIVL